MTIRNLEKLFSPKSIAVIGASDRPGSVGLKMTENILASGFKGKVWLVNPKHKTLNNLPCYANVESLPAVPDLALVAVPPAAVAGVVQSLSIRGAGCAIILTAGLREAGLTATMLDAAKPGGLRIVGPNCLGVMVPAPGINAGFARTMPAEGGLAFISQSGAIVSAVTDWSKGRNIGFSAVVSVGDAADVDVGDLLDHFAADAKTKAILMYLEQVTDARKFMSAARAAARVKPVVVIKSGRHTSAARAAATHTGALAGSDAVYDAAFLRAGILRVKNLGELFDAAETLGSRHGAEAERLAIVTNGGGAGILAADALEDQNGVLAGLSPDTVARIKKSLPAGASLMNPVDLVGDADAARYGTVVTQVLADPGVDAVLVINCPTALSSGTDAATATLKAFDSSGDSKTLLTCWLGGEAAQDARALFNAAGISTFETPRDAILGFGYLAARQKAQDVLQRVPPQPAPPCARKSAARGMVATALRAGRMLLNEAEAKELVSTYGINVVPTMVARTPEEAGQIASALLTGRVTEVVVKIISPDISHKSDVGGVALNLPTAFAAQEAARVMQKRIASIHPQFRLEGFTVQPMLRKKGMRELIIGASVDPTFGPVVLFGSGGTAVEVIADRAIGLPPLDAVLAKELMKRTNVYRLLQAYRDTPAADIEGVAQAIVRVSEMLADIPEIAELDINPLWVTHDEVTALDVRIHLATPETVTRPGGRFAIRPYPGAWESEHTLVSGRTINIRPVRPDDARLYPALISHTSPDDMHHRFFAALKELSPEHILLLTQIDYARAMAFAAVDAVTGDLLGVSRLVADPDYQGAEYALLVRSDQQRQGIGTLLLQTLIDYAKAEGFAYLWGDILYDNLAMANLCTRFGFSKKLDSDEVTHIVTTLDLRQQKEAKS